MNTATHIERRKDRTGRTLFVVGYVATYSEAEAIALTDEMVDTLLCPITIAALAAPELRLGTLE